MRWKGARKSTNVEDHRGRGGGKGMAMGGGVIGIIMAVIAVVVFNQDPMQFLQDGGGGGGSAGPQQELTAAERELGDFVSTVLSYTEEVWDDLYPLMARSNKFPKPGGFRGAPSAYQRPKLILFTGMVNSGCGKADAGMGPFYCPADQKVYIDLAFYDELKTKFEAPGDFAQAYVIAHEVGHHIQNLLGLSDYVHQQRSRISKEEYNRLSVRLELHADYLAGVWAHRGQKEFKFLEQGDIEEGLNAAAGVGDDRIQKKAQGWANPESFTHGTADQRMRWFKRGLQTGDPVRISPFDVPYNKL